MASAVGAAALSLGLVACGGGDDDSAGQATGSDGGPAPVKAMFNQIYGVPSIGSAAQDLGIWTDAGLDVEILEGEGVAQALVSGDVDIAWGSPMRFIAAAEQGATIKIVGSTSNVFDSFVIARSDLGAEKLEDLEDMKGLRFGITSVSSSGNYGSEALAESFGWSEDEYDIQTLGSLDSLRASLSQGNIDVFLWSASAAFALEDAGDAVILGNLADVVGPAPFGVLAASDAAIEDKPDSLRMFCDGYYEAQKTLQDDPDQAVQILVDKGGLDPALAPRIVESGLGFQSTDDSVPDESWETMAEQTMSTNPDITDLTADDVRDMFVACSSL